MQKIFIIDDDKDICLLLSKFLTKNGYEASFTHTAEDALQTLRTDQFDLILCDYKLPNVEGVELLQKIKILDRHIAVIIITGYSDVRTAVETLKHGACDYVTKPLYPDEILVTIKEALKKVAIQPEPAKTSKPKKTTSKFVEGVSEQSKSVAQQIALIAPTDMSVIITGETGTGKEFVANAIHHQSNRADGPFVAIDCGAIPKELAGSELFGHVKGSFTGALKDKQGSFEMANGGTLFLDEIGNLSYDNQIKLLRVLQERKIRRIGSNSDIPIDVRVLAATNENLRLAVRENRFREDIYHRLNEFKIELAPLRERPDDVALFATHFLAMANGQLNKDVAGFDAEAMEVLKSYSWHGNLRELSNVIKRAVLLCPEQQISVKQLPEEILYPLEVEELEDEVIPVAAGAPDLKVASGMAERQVIINALKKSGYNKTKAAKLLNIDRKTLYNKLKAFDIKI